METVLKISFMCVEREVVKVGNRGTSQVNVVTQEVIMAIYTRVVVVYVMRNG